MGVDAEMFVRTRETVTDDQLRRWAFELKEGFGDVIWRKSTGSYVSHGLERVVEYEQDGPTIKPLAGETFIRVNLFCRYYGPGYERGPATDLIAVGQWLEGKIPGAEVWYGGDSSGRVASVFDKSAREALWQHFLEFGHRPYHQFFGHGKELICDFCKEPAIEHMWGRGKVGFSCHGCDGHWLRDEATGVVVESNEKWEPTPKAPIAEVPS